MLPFQTISLNSVKSWPTAENRLSESWGRKEREERHITEFFLFNTFQPSWSFSFSSAHSIIPTSGPLHSLCSLPFKSHLKHPFLRVFPTTHTASPSCPVFPVLLCFLTLLYFPSQNFCYLKSYYLLWLLVSGITITGLLPKEYKLFEGRYCFSRDTAGGTQQG